MTVSGIGRRPGPRTRRAVRLVGALTLLTAFGPVRARAGEVIIETPDPASAPSETPKSVPTATPTRTTTPWTVLKPLALEVREGRSEFDIPTRSPRERTLVIVSSLATRSGPFAVRVSARATERPRPPRLADEPGWRSTEPIPPDPPLRALMPSGVTPWPAPGMPPNQRTFSLLVREGDVASAGNYQAVPARLRALGRKVQIYVDDRDLLLVSDATLRDIVSTFDARIHPRSAEILGMARDVDGDGRLTVLISSWLGRLAGGKLAVDGFVRGSDFDLGLAAPFGNRCDMVYLNAGLKPGPHLHTILAHEYTHAVTLSVRLRTQGPGDRSPPLTEEEGWLDEALAHLAEDLHGFGRTNLDYRVSAFLSRPEAYRLVVEDYYAANLFRSHGNRGATYLFLRWCVDRFGPNLLRRLARSERKGLPNLEAATGRSFAALFRAWSVALYTSGLDPADPVGPDFTSLDLRGHDGDWILAGPRSQSLEPGGLPRAIELTGTACSYTVVSGAAKGVTVEVVGLPEAELQVTALLLPADLAELRLDVRAASPMADGTIPLRLDVRETGGTLVRLRHLAWEPLTPAPNPHASGFRRAAWDARTLAAKLGSETLAGGGSASLPRERLGPEADGGSIVLKLVGTDAKGHRVAAWADLPGPTPATDGSSRSDDE